MRVSHPSVTGATPAGSDAVSTAATLARRKAVCRERLRSCTARLAPAVAAEAARSIHRFLLDLPELTHATRVAAYAAMAGEIPLDPVLAACRVRGQSVLFPRYNAKTQAYDLVPVEHVDQDLAPGRFGVREPVASRRALPWRQVRAAATVWLVPGIGFDRAGNRLGRGRGYYDRLLAGSRGCRIGVAHACALVRALPATVHDMRMNLVVTDRGVTRPASIRMPAHSAGTRARTACGPTRAARHATQRGAA